MTIRVSAMLTCILLLAGSARAQDTHYWNLFYGTQATLLGGAVIGSASDLSATYYNPGMLAVNREQGLLLGANVYQLQKYTLDQSSRGSTTETWIGPAPALIAGRVPVDSTVLGGIAYSILTRQALRSDLQSRLVGSRDLIGNDGIPEQFSSELVLGAKLSDTWVGVTLFRLVHPKVGIGLTNYVSLRNQTIRSDGMGQALSANGVLTNITRVLNVEYYNIRLLWKFGVGVNLDPLTLGLTVTTPSVNLFGTGSLFADYSGNYSGIPGDTARTEVLVATHQKDLASRYKTSWAVGAGLGYRFGKSRIHFSLEWYAPVSYFNVLETSPFTGQSNGRQYPAAVTQEMKSVINAGLGFEHSLSSSLGLFGSVVTDFSNVPAGTASNLPLTTWNLIHFSAGAVISFSAFDLTVGGSLAGGTEALQDIPWVHNPASLGAVLGASTEGEVRYLNATAVLAFTFKF
jgi:hypothetical protein